MTPIGLLTSALCVPRFAQRVGGNRAAVGFALIAAAALVLMAISAHASIRTIPYGLNLKSLSA